jgi:hypothetical protein
VKQGQPVSVLTRQAALKEVSITAPALLGGATFESDAFRVRAFQQGLSETGYGEENAEADAARWIAELYADKVLVRDPLLHTSRGRQ